MEKTIPLSFKREDYEEIYFKNKQGHILFSPLVKRELITLIIILLLLIVVVIYSKITNRSAWLIVILSLIAIMCFIPYYLKALQVQKWRSGIKDFLNENEKIKAHKLVLTESSLSLVQDDKEKIHKWSAFTHIEITSDYLILTGPDQFFFPKKSMLPEDYTYLIQMVKSQMEKNPIA